MVLRNKNDQTLFLEKNKYSHYEYFLDRKNMATRFKDICLLPYFKEIPHCQIFLKNFKKIARTKLFKH